MFLFLWAWNWGRGATGHSFGIMFLCHSWDYSFRLLVIVYLYGVRAGRIRIYLFRSMCEWAIDCFLASGNDLTIPFSRDYSLFRAVFAANWRKDCLHQELFSIYGIFKSEHSRLGFIWVFLCFSGWLWEC